ncbi:MAG TPA: restriction endonuclease subunit S [Vicinamibacterales bacterium]|nr:restriction endonuclease subunit S [Vicinamibacterales bacterium]
MSAHAEVALAEVLADATPGFACGEDVEDGVFQFRMNNVTIEGQLDLTKRRRVPKDYRNIDRFLLRPGDVLFNATNSPDLVGKAAFFPGLEEPAVFSNHFLRLRPRDGEIDGRYLTRWLNLQFLHGRFRGMCRQWVNQATVSRDALLSLKIPLPPLPEQKRIAEILDQADALRAKRHAALKKLDELTQSIFLDMFGDPATNPKGWPVRRLGEVSEFFAGSTLPRGEPYRGQVDGYFLLKVSDMNLPGNDVYLKVSQEWSDAPGAASCTCPEGSIVIPKRGGAIGTNKKRITTRPSVLDPNLMAIVPQRRQVELQFLYAWLLHVDLASITSGSSVPQLNKRDLDPLSIAVPPVDLQKEFTRRVAGVEKIVQRQRAAASRVEALFSSLQHRAFQGKL